MSYPLPIPKFQSITLSFIICFVCCVSFSSCAVTASGTSCPSGYIQLFVTGSSTPMTCNVELQNCQQGFTCLQATTPGTPLGQGVCCSLGQVPPITGATCPAGSIGSVPVSVCSTSLNNCPQNYQCTMAVNSAQTICCARLPSSTTIAGPCPAGYTAMTENGVVRTCNPTTGVACPSTATVTNLCVAQTVVTNVQYTCCTKQQQVFYDDAATPPPNPPLCPTGVRPTGSCTNSIQCNPGTRKERDFTTRISCFCSCPAKKFWPIFNDWFSKRQR